MKKYVFIFLLTLLPMMASADESGTCGDNLTWTFESATSTLTIAGDGAMYNYSYQNAPWSSLRDAIKTIVLEDGLTSIGKYAFCECYRLRSVTIGNSVTSIRECAFLGCNGLTSVTIPNSVTSIGTSAFNSCI